MTEQRSAAGRLARTAAQTSEAQLKRAATQQINALAQHAWKSSDQPTWLTAEFYSEKIQPALISVRGSVIARTLKVSNSYARDIRKRRKIPHPRHWKALSQLTSPSAQKGQDDKKGRTESAKPFSNRRSRFERDYGDYDINSN
jgi:hypothetical protein